MYPRGGEEDDWIDASGVRYIIIHLPYKKVKKVSDFRPLMLEKAKEHAALIAQNPFFKWFQLNWQIFKLVPKIRFSNFVTITFEYMTNSAAKIDLSTSISDAFAERTLLSINELLLWLKEIYPKATNESLTWRIHDLKSKGILESPGRGMYRLGKVNVFQPVLGNVARRIAALLAKELPLVKTCVWETRWINGWMELQPPYNWTIVETEKEVLEFVFTSITSISKKVFLDPDRKVVDLYVLALNESVIVKPLLSETPTFSIGKITTAAPEKILVDIVAEPGLFRAQQGELDRIYANAFHEVRINQTKMLRYANRRRKYDFVYSLIPPEHRLPKTS